MCGALFSTHCVSGSLAVDMVTVLVPLMELDYFVQPPPTCACVHVDVTGERAAWLAVGHAQQRVAHSIHICVNPFNIFVIVRDCGGKSRTGMCTRWSYGRLSHKLWP